jgi:hypothetical protein
MKAKAKSILAGGLLLLASFGCAGREKGPVAFTRMTYQQLERPGNHGKYVEVVGYLYGQETAWYLSEEVKDPKSKKPQPGYLVDMSPFGTMCRRFEWGTKVRLKALYAQGKEILGYDGIGRFGFIYSIEAVRKK